MVRKDPEGVPAPIPPDKSGEPRFRLPLFMRTGAALALMALGGCGSAQKVELDREVDRLCAIDGGVHVYEVVRLPKEDFGPDGTVFPQYRRQLFTAGRYGSEYVGRIADQTLVSGNPALVRMNTLIVRVSDNKVLGEVVIYRRSGGGGPGLSERSEHSCPKGPVFGLESQVFKPQEK